MDGVKTDKSSKILGDIFRQLEIKDLWKEKHSKLEGNTWCDANNIPKSRIDYILISESTILKIKKISLKKIPGTHNNGTRMSDHKSFNFDLSIHEKERGKGHWKLNIKLLECKEYKLQVNK